MRRTPTYEVDYAKAHSLLLSYKSPKIGPIPEEDRWIGKAAKARQDKARLAGRAKTLQNPKKREKIVLKQKLLGQTRDVNVLFDGKVKAAQRRVDEFLREPKQSIET